MLNIHRKKRGFIWLPRVAAATVFAFWSASGLAGEWRAGGNLLAVTNPYIDGSSVLVLFPVAAYKSDRFYANLGNPGLSFFRGSTNLGGLGYSLFKDENYQIDLIGRLRPMGLDPDGRDKLSGLNERKSGFDAGLHLFWETAFGELDLDLLTDISNRSKGQEATLSYAYQMIHGPWTLRPELGVSWQSSELADYYFGVDTDETRAGRLAYQAASTLTPFVGVQLEYAITERSQLLGGVGFGRLGDTIRNSPIVDERGIVGGYLGLTYSF